MEKPMAPDERDRSFDKALARHLRSAAPAGEGARLPEAPASHTGACPDSEALAAYHERSLLPEQLNSLKEHIVGCGRCQAILVQLEATDEISLQAFEQEEVVAKGAVSVLAARNVEVFPAAAPSQSPRAAQAAPPRKSRRALLLRGTRWQWLAPAGALAAGLLVWIALHENQPLSPPSLNHVQIATKQAPPPPPPSVSTTVHEAPPPKAALSKPQSATDEFASANTRGAADAMKSNQKLDSLARVSPSQPLADKEGRLRKDAERESSIALLRAEEQLDRDAKTAGAAKQEKVEVQPQAQATNGQFQNQTNANSQKVPGPAPLGQTDNRKKEMKAARAAAAPPEPAAGPAAGLTAATSMMEVVTVSNPRLIVAPGSNVLWRAGRLADRFRSFGQSLLDRGPRWSHSSDYGWRRALDVDFFAVVGGSWRNPCHGCSACHDLERPKYQKF